MKQKILLESGQVSNNSNFNSEHIAPMDYGVLKGFVASVPSKRDASAYVGFLALKLHGTGVLSPRLSTSLNQDMGIWLTSSPR